MITFHEIFQDTDKPIEALIARVPAGEPMEIVDELELVDMNYLFTKGLDRPMLIRVDGDSMVPEIARGDWVILAVGKEPLPGQIVVGYLNGGYTIKRYKLNSHRGRHGLYLVPTNGMMLEREITDDDDYSVVGVVTAVVHPTA